MIAASRSSPASTSVAVSWTAGSRPSSPTRLSAIQTRRVASSSFSTTSRAATHRLEPCARVSRIWRRRWRPGTATRLGAVVQALEPVGERITVRVAESDRGAEHRHRRRRPGHAGSRSPEAIADPLLQTAERDFLARARYVAAIVMAVALDRTVVGRATRTRVPDTEGWPVATIAVQPGGVGAPAPEGKELALVTASGRWSRAHLETPDEIVEKDLLGLLQRLHPGSSSAVSFSTVRRYRQAFPRFDVGRYREIARFRRVQRDLRAGGRRLYFAGDYLVGPSLEGAVTSGFRAADQIVRDLGVPAAQSSSSATVTPSPPSRGSADSNRAT